MKNMQNKIKGTVSKQLINSFIVSAASLILVFLVYELWNKDFTVPLFYEENGDTLGALYTIKNIADGHSLFDAPYINAPHEIPHLLQDYILQAGIIKVMTLFTKDLGILANSFWLLTYVLTAITTYLLLKKLRIHDFIAMMGSIIFAFLPYHYFRISHFWLMAYYIVPLAAWIIIDLLDEDFLINDEKTFSAKKFFCNKCIYLDLIFAVIISLHGIYYSLFTLLIIWFAVIVTTIRIKKWQYLLLAFCDSVMIILPIIITYILPVLFSNTEKISDLANERNIYQMDLYALRIIYLILPIPEHRIDALSKSTAEIYNQLGTNTEVYMAHLGIIMTIGMIISFIALFINSKNTKESLCQKMGKINIFVILLSVVGGFDLLIGIFITPSIRCFNRVSVFIALFSLIAFCSCIENLSQKIKTIRKNIAIAVVCFALTIVGVLDQTAGAFADFSKYNIETRAYENAYTDNSKQYLNTKEFVESIETVLNNEQSMILQFPLAPENVQQFAQTKFALMSDKLSWSSSISINTHTFWLEALKQFPLENILKIASIYDFSGILVDKNVFSSEDEFREMYNMLQKEINADPITDSSGEVYFYDLRDYRNQVLQYYSITEEERLDLINEIDALFDRDFILEEINISELGLSEKCYKLLFD